MKCTTVDETIPGLPMAPDDRVSVVLANGKVIEHPPVAYAKGSWERPLDREELLEKFLDCATRRLEWNHAQARRAAAGVALEITSFALR